MADWTQIVEAVEQHVKDATGWTEFNAEESMTMSHIQEFYDRIESDDD
jgi:hypothetical protein